MSTDTVEPASAAPASAPPAAPDNEAPSSTLPDPEAPPLFPYGNRVGEIYIPLSAYDTDTALARRVLDKLWPLNVSIVALDEGPTLKIVACSELFRENTKDDAKQVPLYDLGLKGGEVCAIEIQRPERKTVWTPNRKERREMARAVANGSVIVRP